MNWLRLESTTAWTRLKHWVFPSALRRYGHTADRKRISRFPSVGSEPVTDHRENAYIDYKTAYRDSTHHIRYNVDLHPEMNSSVFLSDPFGETVPEKLVRFGFLAKDHLKDTEAIEKAKQMYQDVHGESADVRVYRDDFEFTPGMEDKDSREFINEFVASIFDGVKQYNHSEAWLNDLDEVYRAQFYHLKSFDMAADDPVYRQLVLDLEWQIDQIAERRVQMGEFPVFKAKKSAWNILDDSHSNENIQKVQSSVGVFDVENHQEHAHALVPGKVPVEEPQATVHHPPSTNFVKDEDLKW